MALSDEAFGGSAGAGSAVAASGAPGDGRALQRLLDELGRLPGIGPKSAQRIAYYLLEADARPLGNAIVSLDTRAGAIADAWNAAEEDGLMPEALSHASLFAAITAMVEQHGEELTADFFDTLPDRM